MRKINNMNRMYRAMKILYPYGNRIDMVDLIAETNELELINAGSTYRRYRWKGWVRTVIIFFDLTNDKFVKGWK